MLGATSGGPPTTYTWTRNGQVITNSAAYSISIQVERSSAGFQNSRYRSTLTVTGRLPGVYQYSVTNRATSGMLTDTFTIESKTWLLVFPRTWISFFHIISKKKILIHVVRHHKLYLHAISGAQIYFDFKPPWPLWFFHL